MFLRFYDTTQNVRNTSLGGAERLVVDAALGLQSLGHAVDIYTSHHDPNHCFDETRDGNRPHISSSSARFILFPPL